MAKKKAKLKENKRIKICFTSSSGGHLEEISRLNKIAEKYEHFLITEKSSFSQNKFGEKKYYVPQTNRKEILFIFKYIYIFIYAFFVLAKEKPDVIISTGALITYPVCIIGKLFKKKIVYIESFARCDKPSLTGRLMYKHADLFIVQWEEMIDFYPNAVYGGGIF